MLELEKGKKVVELARRIIDAHLKGEEKPEVPDEINEKMQENRGVFVTLNKNERLRGCIGRPYPDQPLKEGLADSAVNAAVSDPRFPSLDPGELKDVTVEVSILTTPEEIEVEDPKKYPEEIEIGRDGLIVESGVRKGLLLPQVPVDQGWDVEEFLSQTCAKAGAMSDCWLEKNVKIKKFSAQVFKEKEPEGEIVEEGLSS